MDGCEGGWVGQWVGSGQIIKNLINLDLIKIAHIFYPYFQGFMEGRSLLVVYVFTSPDSPRGPPWNEGHRPKVRHETDVLEVPASGTTRTQFLF